MCILFLYLCHRLLFHRNVCYYFLCILLIQTYSIEDIFKYVTDFSQWGANPLYSDFVLPNNHEIILKFDNTPNIQVACSDTNNNWIYAWNIGLNGTKNVSYKSSTNRVVTDNLSFDLDTNIEYKLSLNGNTLLLYADDVLIATKTTYDTLGITRKIRIYENADNVEWLKVKAL